MELFKKIKRWMTDCPGEPEIDILEVFIPKGPILSATDRIMKYGLPFHIQWKSQAVRRDN